MNRPKAQLWVIVDKASYDHWADDNGGDLFTSPEMAQRTMDKHKLNESAFIEPCGLDDDLAQMGRLYHET